VIQDWRTFENICHHISGNAYSFSELQPCSLDDVMRGMSFLLKEFGKKMHISIEVAKYIAVVAFEEGMIVLPLSKVVQSELDKLTKTSSSFKSEVMAAIGNPGKIDEDDPITYQVLNYYRLQQYVV